MYKYLILLILCFFMACDTPKEPKENQAKNASDKFELFSLDLNKANALAELPIKCVTHPLPYKTGWVFTSEEDLQLPQKVHPAFYGCFDWHSAVHGHWSLIYLLKQFPDLEKKEHIISLLDQNLTEANILKELDYFKKNKFTKSFERTYGWAWLLKLAEELHTWENDSAKKWAKAISPLAEHIAKAYMDYLPKLIYPIRVGEHSNTAFGLSFAWDYALAVNHSQLQSAVRANALRMYNDDKNCPIEWEPSGYDFLSPCFQELDLMRKILSQEEFYYWAKEFMPTLLNGTLKLAPAIVADRSDGKLVHLDGLNFSRAWCLYQIPDCIPCVKAADHHLKFSFEKISDGDYAGEHWLASFALYAFKSQQGSF